MTSILQAMSSQLPQATIQQAFNSLGADAQNAVAMAMQVRQTGRVVTP